MATKIRLQRHGRKGKPFFHIVVADSRAKRDGRNPATGARMRRAKRDGRNPSTGA